MAEPLDIKHSETPSGGRYFTTMDGHEAELTYSRLNESTVVADHTGVPKAIGGRGVGQALVEQAVKDAREKGVSVVPLCPFVAAMAKRHPDWQDVIVLA